jgi:putative DNA primase/helicase
LSTGLANINQVRLEKKPRMADFARVAVAAEPAYTDGRYKFATEYASNRERAADTVVENSPVGEVLLRLLANTPKLEETPENLFLKLTAAATEYDRNSQGWPKHHNQLKELIERIAPALDRLGLRAGYKKTNGKRLWRVWRVSSKP